MEFQYPHKPKAAFDTRFYVLSAAILLLVIGFLVLSVLFVSRLSSANRDAGSAAGLAVLDTAASVRSEQGEGNTAQAHSERSLQTGNARTSRAPGSSAPALLPASLGLEGPIPVFLTLTVDRVSLAIQAEQLDIETGELQLSDAEAKETIRTNGNAGTIRITPFRGLVETSNDGKTKLTGTMRSVSGDTFEKSYGEAREAALAFTGSVSVAHVTLQDLELLGTGTVEIDGKTTSRVANHPLRFGTFTGSVSMVPQDGSVTLVFDGLMSDLAIQYRDFRVGAG